MQPASASCTVFVTRVNTLSLELLILDPVKHLAGSLCRLCPRDSVNPDHEENLRILRRSKDHSKAVAGRVPGVSARRRTRFH